jgi:hypothetical protein
MQLPLSANKGMGSGQRTISPLRLDGRADYGKSRRCTILPQTIRAGRCYFFQGYCARNDSRAPDLDKYVKQQKFRSEAARRASGGKFHYNPGNMSGKKPRDAELTEENRSENIACAQIKTRGLGRVCFK